MADQEQRLRVLITSDWHLDASTAGFSREDDLGRIVDWVVEQAIAFKADLFVFLGDLCDPTPNRAPRCAATAISVAQRLAVAGIASRWLVGNHDVIEDGSGTSTLEPLAIAGVDSKAHVWRSPVSETIGGVEFIALPYTPRCDHYDAADVLEQLLGLVPPGRPVVVCGHLSVDGAALGGESHEMARGRAMGYPRSPNLARALCLNGHYHRAQVAGSVFIPGSLARLTFGEAANRPGVFLLEVGAKGTAKPKGMVGDLVRMAGPPKGMALFHLVCPLLAVRPLLDIGPEDSRWDLGGIRGDETGAIVRMEPPPGASDEQITALLEEVRRVAAAVQLRPRPHARPVPAGAPVQLAANPPAPIRAVVQQLATAAVCDDHPALDKLLDTLLTEAGL